MIDEEIAQRNKELLKRAAKAANINIEFYETRGSWVCKITNDYDPNSKWNPIDNSADAFDLVVDLGLVVSVNLTHTSVGGWSEAGDEIYVDHGDDKHAATRLAIVMAAAELN